MPTRVSIPFSAIRTIQRDPLGFLLRNARRHGDFIEYPLFRGAVAYQLTHPDLIQHVLLDNHRNYNKDTIQFNQLSQITGRGLLTSDGAFWLRQRRMSQPAFHRRRIAAMSRLMTAAIDQMLRRWEEHARSPSASSGQSSRPIDVDEEMMEVTLTIIGQALLGQNLQESALDLAQSVLVMLDDIVRRARNPLAIPRHIPTPHNRRVQAALARLDAIIHDAIARHRASPDAYDTILTMLLAARDRQTGEAMTAEQLRDEVITFLVAGHETAASALNWVFYLLATHPSVNRRLQAEVDGVLNGRLPAIDDLPQLPFTGQVIDETMRLYPPSWVISRRAIADDRFDGGQVPAGAIVIISPYAVHRHTAFWPNPEGFDPDRFGLEAAAERHRYAYIPFGGGPRLCIGDSFARAEMQLLLAAVTGRFELQLLPGHPVVADPLVTIRPRHGMLMSLQRRPS